MLKGALDIPDGGPTRSAVFITATEPEPRSYGKPVVVGGIMDHLCDRLGPQNVHMILVGRTGIERPPVPYRQHLVSKPRAWEQATSLLRRVILPPRRSLQEAALFSSRVRGNLGDLLAEIDPDLQIWDTVRMGQYANDMPRKRRILYADDLFSARYDAMLSTLASGGAKTVNPGGQFAKLLPGPARALLASPYVYRPLLRLERDLVAASEGLQPHWFDSTLLTSETEAAALRQRCDAAGIGTLPPLLPDRTEHSRVSVAKPTFVFLGGFAYAPNVDGLDWFLSTCRDEVLSAMPDFRLEVVGSGTERGLPSAAAWGDRVRFLGWVDELDAVLDRSAALLSPLRTGSGVKIKVLEALARRMPVVATPAGVQGIDAPTDSGCLVASDPAGLASAMASVSDPATGSRLSDAAWRAWNTRYRSSVVRRHYDRLFGLEGGAAYA